MKAILLLAICLPSLALARGYQIPNLDDISMILAENQRTIQFLKSGG